ncbi:MAG: hypothetical protein ACFFBW_16095 [Promethearchaeota archaeon]
MMIETFIYQNDIKSIMNFKIYKKSIESTNASDSNSGCPICVALISIVAFILLILL